MDMKEVGGKKGILVGLGDMSDTVDIMKDQVEVTLTLFPWPRVSEASWPCWMRSA